MVIDLTVSQQRENLRTLDELRLQVEECLFGKGGEVSARARAVGLGQGYLALSDEGRAEFLSMLATDFGPGADEVRAGIRAYEEAHGDDERIRAEVILGEALRSPRIALLRRFSSLENGMKFLVDMRAQLYPLAKKDPALEGLLGDLTRILSSWFDIGLLQLTEISWESPAAILEKLIQYEAVHAIQSWRDLKHRLGDSDHRCFGFFHPKMGSEPLIFVEVFLTRGLADNITDVLEADHPIRRDSEKADTAIFYSISNAQQGLRGIAFGSFLIRRVVRLLLAERMGIEHFSSLSPIPRFRQWLGPALKSGEAGRVLSSQDKWLIGGITGNDDWAEGLADLLETYWHTNPEYVKALRKPLLKLCVHYLIYAKWKDRAFDPVANFHLSNGARLERLNWLGDVSEKGMEQSAGIMCNYYYDLSDIERNHEAYATDHWVETSPQIRKLLDRSDVESGSV